MSSALAYVNRSFAVDFVESTQMTSKRIAGISNQFLSTGEKSALRLAKLESDHF